MPTPKPTEAEIISYLQRTELPTLLVEGDDDAKIYRYLERRLGIFSGSTLACSGREVLISIYRKRNTFRHGKLAWLADLDLWKFSTPPSDLDGIIFTAGYSIENDLYAGKILLQTLVKFLSGQQRDPKYGYSAVVEICLKLYPSNPYIQQILDRAQVQLSDP